MEKVTHYKKIVKELIEYVYSLCPKTTEVDIQKVIDDENGHYMLQSVGWEGKHWVYGSFVHIDVKPTGRVWLQHDDTDLRIADDLEKRGIPKFDIVVDF